ncbi:small GTPase superfamily protein [Kipferlia bialata]|uniref:Small GTPase superfamily protein n=1 Tax=Kipferlia bialata TaxID=797122 RepID=A0A9K3GHT4_9EUKA|nr:small GTPase superfamily protein [Kipferlia bialata]GIQ84679.1 small GTPase superfamily protein [Kipferlia bialata]|eukprot:g3961.t1
MCQSNSKGIFFRDAFAIYIVAALQDPDQWGSVEEWHSRVREAVDGRISIPVYLLLNKVDLVSPSDRQRCLQRGRDLAARLGLTGVYLTSAKTGEGLRHAVTQGVTRVLELVDCPTEEGEQSESSEATEVVTEGKARRCNC